MSVDHRYIYRYFLAWTCCRDIFGQNRVIAQPQSINRLLALIMALVMALSTTFTQYAPKITKFLKNHAK